MAAHGIAHCLTGVKLTYRHRLNGSTKPKPLLTSILLLAVADALWLRHGVARLGFLDCLAVSVLHDQRVLVLPCCRCWQQ